MPFVVMIYAWEHPLVWGIIPVLLWRLYRYDKVFLIMTLFLVMSVVFQLMFFEIEISSHDTQQGVVTSLEANREHPRLRLKTDNGNYIVYDESLSHINIGDTLMVRGDVTVPEPNGFFTGFNYDQYLTSINIDGIIYAEAITTVSETFNIYRLRHYAHTYIDNHHPESAPSLKAFILASRSDMDASFYENVQSLGIAHLFAVSGLHVGFMVLALKRMIAPIIKHPPRIDLVLGIFLLGYMFITAFAPSVIRASLMFGLLAINKHLNLNFSALDLVMGLCMVLIVIHPYFIYQVGFQLSFLVSISLILGAGLLKDKSRFQQGFIVSIIAFSASAPIILNMQGSLNVMSIVFNVFYVTVMTVFILPMAYATFFIPWLDSLFGWVMTLFNYSVQWIDHLLSLHVRLIMPQGVLVVFYFMGFIWIFSQRKLQQKLIKASYVITMITVVNLMVLYSPFQSLTMYDVDGDAFLLRDRFNQCNMLIDVGNVDPHNNLANALHAKNVRRLDYVFISHKHRDHYGEYPTISESFTIDKTITNHSQHHYENTWVQCGNIEWFIFPRTRDFGSENDNSMIMKVRFMNQRILFTGDIENQAEADFLERYHVKADWLKVAHHGSITSSSETFIDQVNPSVALVPARRNNRFNHPSDVVIDRFNQRGINVYSLKQYGSVEFFSIGRFQLKKTALTP